MFLRLQAYHRPECPDQALAILAQPHTRPIAGGTSLTGGTDDETATLVDLTSLGWSGVSSRDGFTVIGATTPLAVAAAAVSVGTLLNRVVSLAGPPTLLNRATIGGALAQPELWGELVAALLALDARIVVARLDPAGQVAHDEWDLPEFLRRRRELLVGALVEAVYLPLEPVATGLARVAVTPRDTAVVSVAAVLVVEQGLCRSVRVAAAGLTTGPARLGQVEAELSGRSPTHEAIHHAALLADQLVTHPGDFRGSTGYRRHLGPVLVRRALEEAAQAAEEAVLAPGKEA